MPAPQAGLPGPYGGCAAACGIPHWYEVKGSHGYRCVLSRTAGDWQSVAGVAGVVGGVVNNVFTSCLWGAINWALRPSRHHPPAWRVCCTGHVAPKSYPMFIHIPGKRHRRKAEIPLDRIKIGGIIKRKQRHSRLRQRRLRQYHLHDRRTQTHK
jgi:hypothetical protein